MAQLPLKILGMVALAYAILLVLVFVFQGRLLYLPGVPGRAIDTTPDRHGMDFEEVHLTTEDGERLHGWWIPAPGNSRGTVLIFHGNAGNISHRIETIRSWRELRRDVFIFDYRGYGQSTGRTSERGTAMDARAAWRYLTEARGIRPHDIVLFGRSLGGAVATALAAELGGDEAPGALVLESTFTSVPELAGELYPFLPVRFLARIRYPVARQLGEVRVPVLVIHSPEDEIIPFHHGRTLLEAANPPAEMLELRGGHNDGFLLAGRRYVEEIGAFLERAGALPDGLDNVPGGGGV